MLHLLLDTSLEGKSLTKLFDLSIKPKLLTVVLCPVVLCVQTRSLPGGIWSWAHSCTRWNGQCKHELLVRFFFDESNINVFL